MDARLRYPRTIRRNRRVVITERDLSILNAVGRFGMASTAHLAKLYFNHIENTANKRLRSLFDAGYLNTNITLGSNAPTIYTLTTRGRDTLSERTGTDPRLLLVPRTIDVADLYHRLAIVDVRVVMILAARMQDSLQLNRFATAPEITKEVRRISFAQIPDALILINVAGKRKVFALEVDMGTEPLSAWRKKATGYGDAITMELPLWNTSDWTILVYAPGKKRLRSIATCLSPKLNNNRFHLIDLNTITTETTLKLILLPKEPHLPLEKDHEYR